MGDTLLDKIYYDVKHPGSFGSAPNLYKYAKADGYKGRLIDVKSWLKGEDTFTLHKQARLKYPRRPIMARSINNIWEADLVFLIKISKYNSGYKYILTCIDVLSRYGYARPLKTKSPLEVINALKDIFKTSKVKPSKLHTDRGGEFFNATFQKFVKKEKIIHYATFSETKAAICERFNKSIQHWLHKYFTANNTLKYIDVLPDLLNSYNHRVHRSLGMAPADVSPANQKAVWCKLYAKSIWRDGEKPKYRFTLGQIVRISKYKRLFKKGYLKSWTEEYFKIADRIPSKPVTYRLSELSGEILQGIFYDQELQSIHVSDDKGYKIDILKSRTLKGLKQYYVSYRGWPDIYNEWISHKQLV